MVVEPGIIWAEPGIIWWSKPVLVFSLGQAEQYGNTRCKLVRLLISYRIHFAMRRYENYKQGGQECLTFHLRGIFFNKPKFSKPDKADMFHPFDYGIILVQTSWTE